MRELVSLGLGALVLGGVLASTGCKWNAPAPAPDPWTAPPKGADQKNAAYGDGLAKIDPGAALVDPAAAKLDFTAIPTPPEHVELKGFASTEATGFRVVFNPSGNPAHEQYRALFAQQRMFEGVAEGLNKTVRLPASVDIQTVDCNTINAFYDPGHKRIIVCYELVDYFIQTFKPHAPDSARLGAAVFGALTFSLIHEAGHGLIHLLDLPAVGREEDSVDQLATLTLIAGGEPGVAMALSGASWFGIQAKSAHKTPFWDEHAFDGQRFYNILCLIYGSNPTKYDFVADGTLPADRARRCPEEYQKINKAWQALMQPHLTSDAATNVDYQPGAPVAEAAPPTGGSAPAADPGQAPAADPTPTPAADPTPSPAADPASASTPTCEQVAEHAGQLVAAEARERARAGAPEEVDQVERDIEAQLPSVIQDVAARCASDRWPQPLRQCTQEAPTLAQASACTTDSPR